MKTKHLRLDIQEFRRLTAGWPFEKTGFLMKVIEVAWNWQVFPIPDITSGKAWMGIDPRVIRRLYDDKLEDACRVLLAQRAQIEPGDRLEIFQKSGGSCNYCGEPISIDNFHVDHRVPISACGLSHKKNLTAACPRCNLSKGAFIPAAEIHHG